MLRLKKLNLACVAIQACNEPIQSISHLAWNTVRPKGAVITLNSNIMEALGCLFPADKLHPQRSSPITCRSTGEADNAEIIRLRGLLGRLKSEHQNLMQLRVRLVKKKKKFKWIYTDIRKQTYNWVLEIISPQSLKNTQKKTHVLNHIRASSHSYNLQVQTLNNCSFLKRSQYKHNCLFSACSTSTSCMDTMSTPHFVPLSTNAESKESIMTTVLRTGVWPFSRVCSRVSALFWLSHSTVEISAERLKKNLSCIISETIDCFKEASSCTRLSCNRRR